MARMRTIKQAIQTIKIARSRNVLIRVVAYATCKKW